MDRKDQAFLARKIRTQYTETAKEHTELDELRMLDRKVKRPANVFAYVFGSLGALVMGAGMSLVMTDIGASVGIGAAVPLGIAVGTVGLLMAVVNYPIYKRVLASRRKKYADKVIALSNRIMEKEV